MVAANSSKRYEQSCARQYHGEAAAANCKRLQKTILASQIVRERRAYRHASRIRQAVPWVVPGRFGQIVDSQECDRPVIT